MTSDDIIRMAREAGAMSEHMAWLERDLFPVFASFANLVAAAEREACAKVCEDEIKRVRPIYSVVAENALKAIRARGNK